MGHGCRICQSVAVGTAVGVAVGSGSSHHAVVNVREPTAPLIIPRVETPISCLNTHPSRTATPFSPPSTRSTQRAPTASIILTKLLQPIHAILSLYPGEPPNCFGRRLRSSSVRQHLLLAQIDPRQPQLIVGALCAQELLATSESGTL